MATSGAVLEGAKASQTNSPQSDLPQCGVARDFKEIPVSLADLAAVSPSGPIDLHGSQYAASFLDDAQTAQTEYAVWAANSSQVALVPITTTNANTKGVAIGTGSIPQGNLTLGSYKDGATYLNVRDTADRAVGNVLSVVYRKGPTSSPTYFVLVATGTTPPTLTLEDEDGDPIPTTTVLNAFSTIDADAGYVGLSAGALTAIGGGVSLSRGDLVYSSYLVLANQTFWWSKNDAQTTRFTYNGKLQKWLPIKGEGISDLGVVVLDKTYSLSPPATSFDVGDYLPATASDSDKYAMLRVGIIPSAAASTPLAFVLMPAPGQFSGVRVVADDAVANFSFTGGDASLSGVVGVTTGDLVLNPAFATANLGLHLWYSAYSFNEDSNGVVGPLLGADIVPLFISPIPSPTETPFISIGSRRYLSAIPVLNDAALLAAPAPSDSQVLVSLSTGRLRFSPNLPKYADPTDALFDPAYLGEDVIYDGVACCAKAQPLRQPSALVSSTGAVISDVSTVDELYLNRADPFGANGLGTSGIFYLPDGTGSVPNLSASVPARVGGDTLASGNSGLVRRIGARLGSYALGDDVFYWYGGAFAKTTPIGYQDDIPFATDWSIDEDTILVTEAAISPTLLSQVQPNSELQEDIEGPIYYLNALFTPASYTNTATLVSRIRNAFTVSEARSEQMWFFVDNDRFLWSSSLLVGTGTEFTADQMATSLLLSPKIGGPGTLGTLHPGSVYTDRGYLILKGSLKVGIGFGNPNFNLSGCRVTGFLPGWRAVAGQDNWHNDSGLSFGMGRSPLNLDRQLTTPDYLDRVRTDRTLTSSVNAYPFLNVDYPPLRDVVGFGVDTFFRRITLVKGQPVFQDLRQYEEILYDFPESRFLWLEPGSIEALIVQPVSVLDLGNTGVVPDTMLGVEPNPSGGLSVATGNGAYQTLTQGTDYLLPNEGQIGKALLIDPVGSLTATGYRGSWTSGGSTFTDAQADFVTAGVGAGYLLRVYPSGTTTQTYTVTSVTNATTLVVTPAFISTSTGGNWQLFEGQPSSAYDPAIVADMVYKTFDPLPSQTLIVKLLAPLGKTPVNAAAQTANRLRADVADALTFQRTIRLRFGQNTAGSASLTLIGNTQLGQVANGLILTGLGTVRYTTQSFSVLVGNTLFTHGGANPLTPVAAFSPNPVGVEYLTATGELKFNSTVLSNFSGSLVYQVSEFLPPASLQANRAEFKADGYINISADDLAAHQDQTVYFEESLKAGTDMVINPMAGSFYLNKPLRAYQLVETTYWQAAPSGELAVDTRGNPLEVTEFLPFYVTLEVATRINSTQYSFDPPDSNGLIHSVRQDIEPSVYVGSNLQNYGQTKTATIDYTKRVITLRDEVTDTATEVKISYAVNDAFGGERTFSVSTPPVFQPPFFLPANTSSFLLAGDATNRIAAGQMLRLGASTFYVQSVTYDPTTKTIPSIEAPYQTYPNTTGATTVDIFPPTVAEAGLRSPSQQALTLITAQPVTATVNTQTVSTAPAGLFLSVTTPYEPVVRGQTTITFLGPVEFSVSAPRVIVQAGMILEIGGHPYTVADSQLSDDGSQQRITVTAPFIYFYEVTNGDLVRLSARPVYPQGAKQFLPLGPLVSSEDIEVVYFPSGKPGQLLIRDLEWKVDPAVGAIQIITPAAYSSGMASGLQSGDRLLARYTAQEVLGITFDSGIPQLPRYLAEYRFRTIPSEDNGYLGSTVQGRYSFRFPDSFYCRDLPLLAYQGEFAKTISSLTKQLSGQSGGPVFSSSSLSLSDQGQQSLLSQRTTLANQDRAARTYLAFYNDCVVAFEQVLEAIDGRIIGDRNGKFRFYNATSAFLPTPGLTDPITSLLVTRNVFSDVWNANSTYDIPILTRDRIVDPAETVTLSNGVLDGDMMDADRLGRLLSEQPIRIRNDIDDLLLSQQGESHYELLFHSYTFGVYRRMAAPSQFSRLFPEATRGLMLTNPGIDANLANGYKGFYSFADYSWEEGLRSTFLKQAAQVANPVLGPIGNLTSISVELRTPRAWVWGFFPTGIPANSLFVGQAAVVVPCLIATVLPLGQVPINPLTGFPDVQQFAYSAGASGLIDLTTGDPSILLPYWKSQSLGAFWPLMQLMGGTPNGSTLALTAPALNDGEPGGLFVSDVLYGCVVTFKDYNDNPVINAGQLINLTASSLWVPVQGDSLYVRVRPDTSSNTLYQSLRFRDTDEIDTRFATGVIEDYTVFRLTDNQTLNSPGPLQFWQAEVGFSNPNTTPARVPALLGLDKLDSGDYGFPFLRSRNTELERFGQITNAMAEVLTARSPLPNQYYVYPDEILFNGSVQPAFAGGLPPSTLFTTTSLTPVGVGKGSATPFDLVLVQTVTGTPLLPASAEGFQSLAVSSVSGGETLVEVPRFYSETVKGAPMSYAFENVWSNDTLTGTLTLIEDQSGLPPNGIAGQWATLLDFSLLGSGYLDDGQNAGVGLPSAGGFNSILAASPTNAVVITIYTTQNTAQGGINYDAGDYVEQLLIGANGIQRIVAGGFVNGVTYFGWNNNHLLIRFTPPVIPGPPVGTIFDLSNPATTRFGLINNAGGVYTTDKQFNFSISVLTNSILAASTSASLAADRLTFREVYDLTHAKTRGERHSLGGWDLQAKLTLIAATARDSANNPQIVPYLYLNGKTGIDGCPFTFLPRNGIPGVGTIGTFTPATASGAGDEVGTVKVMSWEGVLPVGSGAVLTANLVAGQVDTITVTNGGSGYNGGFVELVIAAPGGANRTATAVATVVGGVITIATVKLKGNGYAAAPAITVRHFAGNQQIPSTTGMLTSVIPSSPEDEVGVICNGTALLDARPILRAPSVSLSQVVKGDVVRVTHSTTDPLYKATVKAGTYLARHAINPTVVGGEFRSYNLTAAVGYGGWAPFQTPTVVAWDGTIYTLTLNTLNRFGGVLITAATQTATTTLTTAEPHGYKVGNTLTIAGSDTVPSLDGTHTVTAVPSETELTINFNFIAGSFLYGGRILDSARPSPPHLWAGVEDYGAFPNPVTYFAAYGQNPRVYAVTKLDGVSTEVVSVEYITGISADPNNNVLQLVPGTARDKNGVLFAGLPAQNIAAFFAALQVGQKVGGMVYAPIELEGLSGLPADNIVAYGTYGLQALRFENTDTNHVADYAAFTAVTPYSTGYTPPVVGNVGVGFCLPADSDRFVRSRSQAVYDKVFGLLDLMGIANNHLGQLDGPAAPLPTRPHVLAGATCLFPSDLLITDDGTGTQLLRVQAGVFLEPSFPVSNLPVVGGPWLSDVINVTPIGPTTATVNLGTAARLRVGEVVAIGGSSLAAANNTFTVQSVLGLTAFNITVTLGAVSLGGDLWGTNQSRLVDAASVPVPLATVGVRHTVEGVTGFEQQLAFEVRRIRRFHDTNDEINANFMPLRYAYETRRGIVKTYSTDSRQLGYVGAVSFSFPPDDPDYENGKSYTGTQLGGFTSPDVNIKPGDLFRLIDPLAPPSERVLQTAIIQRITNSGNLVLEAPGITAVPAASVPNLYFEVWLRNAVVPHQQSCDQLLELVTERTLLDRVADRVTQKGGYVTVPYGPNRIPDYTSAVNKLRDDLMPVGKNFASYGVQIGDIVLIDPQGVVGQDGSGNPQSGSRPFGDISIIERGAPAYTAGKPSTLDDNRGFYRVTKIDAANNVLTVDGSTKLGSASPASPATFPKSVVGKAARGYAVYPTVHDSVTVAPAGAEGQTVLRPTSLPGVDNNNVPVVGQPDSYTVNDYSVRPFSYRIIRPTTLLSTEAVDLILTMRERMLSLIEQFKLALQGNYGGDYWTFQDKEYGRDLGFPTLPDTGLGVFRNLVIEGLMGRIGTTPFTNDSDCLSVLDRRFWILDTRLDMLTKDTSGYGVRLLPIPTPPGVYPYTAYNDATGSDVRPVLPDRIEIVLDARDRLREQRFSWISYRANRLTGTLANLDRFDSQYATARAQQIEAMRQNRSLTGGVP